MLLAQLSHTTRLPIVNRMFTKFYTDFFVRFFYNVSDVCNKLYTIVLQSGVVFEGMENIDSVVRSNLVPRVLSGDRKREGPGNEVVD